MRVFTFVAALLQIGVLPLARAAAEEPATPEKVLFDKHYKIVSPMAEDDEQESMGTYHLRAVERTGQQQIEIVEQMDIQYRGEQVAYQSTVIYGTDPLEPQKAIAETQVGGKPCMTGTIEFHDGKIDAACTGFRSDRTGELFDPVRRLEKKDMPVPEGPLVFQSAAVVLGPRFLPEAGEKKVVFIEFPDDIGFPELVTVRESTPLIRDEPAPDGFYLLKRRDSMDRSTPMARFDKDDNLVSIPAVGKWKLIEAEEETP